MKARINYIYPMDYIVKMLKDSIKDKKEAIRVHNRVIKEYYLIDVNFARGVETYNRYRIEELKENLKALYVLKYKRVLPRQSLNLVLTV